MPSPSVLRWLARHDAELALPSIVVAEISFGIERIRPDERAKRLSEGLSTLRRRFTGRIFSFDEEAAFAYGTIMGQAAQKGQTMSIPDGLIAAIVRVNGGRLATRNLSDFASTGLDLVSPWDS